ncbi:MAG TPA: NAD(P)H-quinone oxidoreductase [Pyrinomonadaceae bacterium]|nr:NAD(P)H-quinone oxidoreductase [Pyrinomonadaceae bacterium]
MKAVYIKEFGGSDNLEIREVSDPPKPTGAQVLVRIKATGLNRADLIQRRGFYPPPAGYSPNIPGLEFAGEVFETGETNAFKTGDRVFGITGGEAQAELLTIDQSLLASIPDNLSFEEAAAIPEVFITAHDAIFTQCELKQGESLLIHAVGSGVGLAALQIAKAKGAVVYGTSRTLSKLDQCTPFGLDGGVAIGGDIKFTEEVTAMNGGRGIDVILDLVGGAYFPENLKALAPKGRIIQVGLTAGRTAEIDLGTLLMKRAKVIGTTLRGRSTEEKAKAVKAFAEDVLPLIASDEIMPNLDRVYDYTDVRTAHDYLESNESFGKVVLRF